MNFKIPYRLNSKLLALVALTFISIQAWSQCPCYCPSVKPEFCFTGSDNLNDCNIGDDCSDIILEGMQCSSSTPGAPYAAVVTPSGTLIATGTYPENLCDLFEKALPGKWIIERLSTGLYSFTYEGDLIVNLISFGDDILDGPKILMDECN